MFKSECNINLARLLGCDTHYAGLKVLHLDRWRQKKGEWQYICSYNQVLALNPCSCLVEIQVCIWLRTSGGDISFFPSIHRGERDRGKLTSRSGRQQGL